MFKTTSIKEWDIALTGIVLGGTVLSSPAKLHATSISLDPGWPYLALYQDDYTAVISELKTMFPNIICKTTPVAFCYFEGACQDVAWNQNKL